MSFLTDLIDEKKAFAWIEQGTPEWDRIRIGRFTASENWKLIVKPKDKTAKVSETTMTYIMEKVAEVMTGQCKQQGYAFPLVWGTEKEPEAREYFIEKTGLDVERVGFFPFTEHAGGSPDGLIGNDAIMEIKCPYDSKVMLEYLMLTDQYDLKRDFREHYWQMVNNMIFTERQRGYFVAFDPRMTKEDHRMKVIEVELKDEDRNQVLEALPLVIGEKLKLLNLLS
jgi:hypothetical protein